MAAKTPPVVDFETEKIVGRPHYPPRPVGVAVKRPGRKARYHAWGHPTGNNCTREQAQEALAQVWEGGPCFHNGKFDLDVADVHMGMPQIADRADAWHDTMLLAYLNDPHAKKIDLKTVVRKECGREAPERDELKAWILSNVRGAKASDWGAYISLAPATLVGPYAEADAEMSELVYQALHDKIIKADMGAAYDRERAIVPVLLGMERRGVTIDTERLAADVLLYDKVLTRLNEWVVRYLKVPEFNVSSADELADALERSGKASNGFAVTPTGKRSTSKESIREAMDDDTLSGMLDYRSTLANYLTTFMRPWLESSRANGGVAYTQWNSTKQESKGGSRTGRLSSSPNYQNVPSDERRDEANKRFEVLRKKYRWLPPLPHVRSYIVAPRGCVILDRDYSQQEPRVLAHFEDGPLCEAYRDDPRMDVYVFGVEAVKRITGIVIHPDLRFARKIMKTVILAVMYGYGLGRLAEKLGVEVAQARSFRDAIFAAMPGIKELSDDLKGMARSGQPMTTWGGRRYYAEPAVVVDGRLREFGYKLINYLIQGSSADITKEAMIRYDREGTHGRLLLTVHDELAAVCPERHSVREMKILKQVMDGVPLDAPLASSGAMGPNWGQLKECD